MAGTAASGARSSPPATISGNSGSTTALASGPTGESTWKSAAIMGKVPTWAAQVTAKGSRNQWQPAQPAFDGRCQQDDGRGTRERELEADVPGQRGAPA